VEGLDERSAHLCLYIFSRSNGKEKEEREAEQRHHKKVALLLSLSFLCFVVCLWRDFALESSVFSLKCASEEEAERDNDAFFFVFFSVYFGREEDAERAEKTERGRERFFFVERDCK
tara:strand:- start:34 stop:384 length:351 start_codon:yes stop_codon:yes gene_type:complete